MTSGDGDLSYLHVCVGGAGAGGGEGGAGRQGHVVLVVGGRGGGGVQHHQLLRPGEWLGEGRGGGGGVGGEHGLRHGTRGLEHRRLEGDARGARGDRAGPRLRSVQSSLQRGRVVLSWSRGL